MVLLVEEWLKIWLRRYLLVLFFWRRVFIIHIILSDWAHCNADSNMWGGGRVTCGPLMINTPRKWPFLHISVFKISPAATNIAFFLKIRSITLVQNKIYLDTSIVAVVISAVLYIELFLLFQPWYFFSFENIFLKYYTF